MQITSLRCGIFLLDTVKKKKLDALNDCSKCDSQDLDCQGHRLCVTKMNLKNHRYVRGK